MSDLLVDLGLEDVWLELCPICLNEDTQIPPCAWCDGLGLIEHRCSHDDITDS